MAALTEERVYELKEAAFGQGKKVHEIVPAKEMAAYKKYCLENLEYLLERVSRLSSKAAVKITRAQIKEMKAAITYLGARI